MGDFSFGDLMWSMVVFFFWFTAIWIFIGIFSDIFRRNDLGGWVKAGWMILIIVLPFLGSLIYIAVRPKMTPQDKEMIEHAQERQRRAEGYSTADEIAKLTKLRDDGAISAEEYENLKQQAMLKV